MTTEPQMRPESAQERQTVGPMILVIDDSEDLLGAVKTALRRRGYQVVTAENGEVALKRIAERSPQLILLDMRMPIMDGWEFARRFREKYGRSVPIVVMTAAEDSKLRADEVGADSYLGKPFELSDLYEIVEDTALRE